MSAERTLWYPSKIDWWLVPVLGLPPVVAIAACVNAAMSGSTTGLLVGIAAFLLVGCIYFGLVFPMRYGLDDEHLIVRFGIFRRRIPLAEIREVEPTFNPLSSPALSLDRLRVRFGPGLFQSVMISPTNRNLFLDELARKTGLKRDGDRLTPL
jgi:hypothetical protein